MTDGSTPLSAPDFGKQELIPAIVQDATSGQVLMLGYMNQESYARTLADEEVWFWSRSRGRSFVEVFSVPHQDLPSR